MRATVIASLLLITGCTGSSVPHRPPAHTLDITGSATCPVVASASTLQPAPLPAGVAYIGVQSCVVDFALRPGRGYWIRVSEKHAVAGGDAYVRALQLPPLAGHLGPHGCILVAPDVSPLPEVVDAAGNLHYPQAPHDGCSTRAEVKAALNAIQWSPVTLRWVKQLLPQGADATCFPSWRVIEHGQRAPIALAGSSESHYQPHTARDAVCYAMSPQASGPQPGDLYAARVVTDRTTAAPMLAALSRRSGAGGCRARAFEAFRIFVGGRYVAIADLGPCLRMIPVVPHPPAGLGQIVSNFSNPAEVFNADEFTTFVPSDMYAFSYGLKSLKFWRGYVARKYFGDACRGFADVSKCQPVRATVKDPIALTFTDVPATNAQRKTSIAPRYWRSGGLDYEQWYVVLRCGRLIGVTVSMLADQAATLSLEAHDVVQSIAPTSRCA